MKHIKKKFLIFAFFAVVPIALAYGIYPDWFAFTLLGIETLDNNIAHILRAVMCLYLGLGLFWLYSAFNESYRNPALVTIIVFTGSLVIGRLISLYADGQPAPILILYIGLELVLVPVAFWVLRMPE
ncbi:DUF4345 domain-containing protein [Vibrio parahaemolyticus]|uniref:DUF4345 domain-containing protein n=1 Tax=Vibrio TaxID=662 RepID=UPI000C0233CD|nr:MULTISPECIES: DUF4345 domain-containing protein [unclassified Vibrio]PHJ43519.1 hypothetical protein AK965_00815 [Vibrio sp. PID17_43]RIZ55084.1 hypothetical protein AK966_07005 [Vibrio sp. PID23_8]